LGAFEDILVEFDENGLVIGVWTINVGNIEGLETFADVGGLDVYIADGDTAAIYKTSLVGVAVTPTLPRGISGMPTPEGTLLFLLVDAEPVDRLMWIDPTTGAPINEFDLPSDEIEGVAYRDGWIWVVDNAAFPKKLYKLNYQDGTIDAVFDLPSYVGEIGGLTTDGVELIAAERFNDLIHFIDPATGGVSKSLNIMDPDPGDPFSLPGGLEAVAYGEASPPIIWGAKYSTLYRIDPLTGNIIGGDFIEPGPPWDVTGLTAIGDIIWLADSATQQVFRGSRPGAPPVEYTTAGDYSAVLRVLADAEETISPATAFTLEKITELVVEITSPTEGATFTTPTIMVQGTVNDPTVDNVAVGVALPETILFGNPEKTDASGMETESDRAQYTTNGLWHFSNTVQIFGQPVEPIKGWVAYYGREPEMDYDTDTPNVGDLDTAEMTLGADAVLTFNTWHETEPGWVTDLKLIQWCVGQTCQTVAQIVDQPPLDPITGAPQWWAPPGTVYTIPPQFAGPGAPTWPLVYIPIGLIDPNTGAPQFVEVSLSLNNFAGQTGRIRFKFDSVDDILNEFHGWLVDDVIVEGAGFKGVTAPVDPDTLTWEAQFILAEGQNTVTAQAIRNAYEPILTDTDQVNVFLDSTPPVVKLKPVVTPTKVAVQTIEGTFSDLTPALLELYVNNKLVMTKKTFAPDETTFSQTISLTEGDNNILVRLTDKGGLKGEDTATILLDTVKPTVQVLPTIYPIGEKSARSSMRGTDPIIIQLKVTDDKSGVKEVVFVPPGPGEQPEPLLSIQQQLQEFPGFQALLDLWGVDPQANYLLPAYNIPPGLAAGTWSFNIKAVDEAGNETPAVATANIVATREAFNIYLLPGGNLISSPMMPLVGEEFDIATLLDQPVPNVDPTFLAQLRQEKGDPNYVAKLSDVVESVFYFTGGTAETGQWVGYFPGPAYDTMTTFKAGMGLWIFAKEEAFKRSPALAPGLPETPAPIKLTIEGQFLKAGLAAPPVTPVVQYWNLVGLHSEESKTVEKFLRGVSVPTETWASLLAYRNYVKYVPPEEAGEEKPPLEVLLGAFESLGRTDTVEPGSGLWLYMVQVLPGQAIVP
jgi:hypothetical protein